MNTQTELLTNESETLFSSNYACKICGFSVPKLEPKLFSFNAPFGACPECKGLGITQKVDLSLLIPDDTKSIAQGGIHYYKNIVNTENLEWQRIHALIKYYEIDMDTPIKDLPKKKLNYLLYGSDVPIAYQLNSRSGTVSTKFEYIEGVCPMIERRYMETTSTMSREWYGSFLADAQCPKCHGARLNKQALSVLVGGKNIYEWTQMSISEAIDFMDQLELTPTQAKIAELVVKEIKNRLSFLNHVGLSYLTLDRLASTLSGGEAQRIRLATQIGSRLTGVMYVLDEPSIGLHQRDNDRLIGALKDNLGDTVTTVGTTSYGKGTEQVTVPFSDGTSFKYTVARWYTPKGTSINKKGFKPDVEVKLGEVKTTSYYKVKKKDVIKKDSVDDNAQALQVYLKYLGYDVDRTDTYFSNTSSQALASFQQDNRLEVTGDCDKKTWDLLMEKVLLKMNGTPSDDTQRQKAIEEAQK